MVLRIANVNVNADSAGGFPSPRPATERLAQTSLHAKPTCISPSLSSRSSPKTKKVVSSLVSLPSSVNARGILGHTTLSLQLSGTRQICLVACCCPLSHPCPVTSSLQSPVSHRSDPTQHFQVGTASPKERAGERARARQDSGRRGETAGVKSGSCGSGQRPRGMHREGGRDALEHQNLARKAYP